MLGEKSINTISKVCPITSKDLKKMIIEMMSVKNVANVGNILKKNDVCFSIEQYLGHIFGIISPSLHFNLQTQIIKITTIHKNKQYQLNHTECPRYQSTIT